MKVLPLLLLFLLQQVPSPTQVVIEDVQIRGNKISGTAIKNRIQSKRGEIFNPALVNRDIRNIYALEQFDDIWVEEEPGTQGGIILVFYVKEKPKIQRVDYKGLTSVTQSDVLKALSDKKASITQTSPYDEPRIRKAVLIIKGLLAEKGRQQAEIEVTKDAVSANQVVVTFNVKEGPKIKIEDLQFEGNKVFSDRALKKAMKLVKEANWMTVFNGKDAYHEGKLSYDLNVNVREMYQQNGYARVNISEPQVEEKPTQIYRTLPFVKPTFPWGVPVPFWKKTVDRVYINIKVEENDQYHVGRVNVEGVKAFKPDFVKRALGIKEGDVYNEKLLRDSFENLRKYVYGEFGFINFTQDTKPDFDEQKKLVNLDINIDEDKPFFVKRINFAGNTTTRDKVIRREVGLYEGGVFNSRMWDQSRMRLNQLGYFEEIKEEDAKVDKHPTLPEVNVTMKVQEKGRNTIGFNGGVSGIGGSFLGFNYETNNFLGFGETLALNFQGGTRQTNIMATFSEPYFLDRPLALGFSVFHSNYKYDQARELFGLNPNDLPSGLGFENRLNFEQKRDGFSLTGSYPWKIWSRFGVTYQLDNSQTDAVNPATRDYFLGVNSQEPGALGTSNTFGVYRTRKMVPNFTYSTVDNPYYPSRGQSLSAVFEYTGGVLGGNTNFYRPTVEYRFFKPHTRHGNIIAMRFSASHIRGFSGTAAPFYERFFPGGDYDIRGFEFRSLGPISFLTRTVDAKDPETGGVIQRPFDDIVYVGGDTQAILNLEYRIPIVGRTVSVAPFLDVGNGWAFNKNELIRESLNFDGTIKRETPQFLPGTNSGVRASTGLEVGVTLPVLNAPFRLIMAWNPLRLDRVYNGPTTGLPFALREEGRAFKFTVGKTF